MASTSSSTPSNPVTLSSTLSLPRSCTSHTANKIENLVEYSYIPESAQISESSYPLISPYQLYKRPGSFTRSIRTLMSTRRPQPKEYIQSSRLDSRNSFKVNFQLEKGRLHSSPSWGHQINPYPSWEKRITGHNSTCYV